MSNVYPKKSPLLQVKILMFDKGSGGCVGGAILPLLGVITVETTPYFSLGCRHISVPLGKAYDYSFS